MKKKTAPVSKKKVVVSKKVPKTGLKVLKSPKSGTKSPKVVAAKKPVVVKKPAAKRAEAKAPTKLKQNKTTNILPLVGLIAIIVVFLLAVGLNALRRLKTDAVLPPNAKTDNTLAIAQNKWLWTGTVAANGAVVRPKKVDAFILSFALDGSLIVKTDCNGGRGTYSITGNKLTISPLASTLMMCAGAQEGDFNNQLQNVASITIEDGLLSIALGGSLENWTMEFKALDESLPISWQSNADAEKFAAEYPMISKVNPFVYTDERQMLNLFDESLAQTGAIYFGFPNCPWCKTLLPELLAAAGETNTDKILYFNPKELRDSGKSEYTELLNKIGQYLDKDEEGNPRLYVPDVYFVRHGEIVGHHEGTLESQTNVEVPLTSEQKSELQATLSGLLKQLQ